jgi:hypothetical protein
METGDTKLSTTFSLDENGESFSNFVTEFTYKFNLELRYDCDGAIPVISKNPSSLLSHQQNHGSHVTGIIYVTNYDVFIADLEKLGVHKGLMFDCYVHLGILFTSFTYKKDTLRPIVP